MSDGPRRDQPLIPEKSRIPLRIASVLIGYLIYRLVATPLVGAALIGIGFVMVDWAVIDRLTTFAQQRSNMMIAGQALLGIGLAAAGIVAVAT